MSTKGIIVTLCAAGLAIVSIQRFGFPAPSSSPPVHPSVNPVAGRAVREAAPAADSASVAEVAALADVSKTSKRAIRVGASTAALAVRSDVAASLQDGLVLIAGEDKGDADPAASFPPSDQGQALASIPLAPIAALWLAPVVPPLALVDSDPPTPPTAVQAAVLDAMRENFADAVLGSPSPDSSLREGAPADGDELIARWKTYQPASDEFYRLWFGWDAARSQQLRAAQMMIADSTTSRVAGP